MRQRIQAIFVVFANTKCVILSSFLLFFCVKLKHKKVITMELHSFQFIQKNIRCKTNEKCHDLPMNDSPGPAEALRQRRFWPQDFFAKLRNGTIKLSVKEICKTSHFELIWLRNLWKVGAFETFFAILLCQYLRCGPMMLASSQFFI